MTVTTFFLLGAEEVGWSKVSTRPQWLVWPVYLEVPSVSIWFVFSLHLFPLLFYQYLIIFKTILHILWADCSFEFVMIVSTDVLHFFVSFCPFLWVCQSACLFTFVCLTVCAHLCWTMKSDNSRVMFHVKAFSWQRAAPQQTSVAGTQCCVWVQPWGGPQDPVPAPCT